MTAQDLDAYCAAHERRFLEELSEFCRIPSISADPAHAADVRRSAEHLAAAAAAAGMRRVELIETALHPAVFAERIVDPALPTALIYGHHDVQPAEPLDEWTSPPFEPEVRAGRLYARGAVDDKGHVWLHLKAMEAHLQTRGEIPLNLKLIVEGEEELGSAHFEDLLRAEHDRLAADVCVVSDTPMLGRGQPSLTVGLRGLAGVEVEVSGPAEDLHSGSFGGTVLNPAQALVAMLATLHDPTTGRVTVPGFYDDVAELTGGERAQLARLPFSEAAFLDEAGGAPALFGEQGYTTIERRSTRPTLEINGIWGGHQGAGWKTIVPARATARISCRLVPDQRPDDIAAKLQQALEAAAPGAVRVHLTARGGARPVLTPTDHPAVRAASRVLADVFGREAVLVREGGSIPAVEIFSRVMGLPVVMVGFGLPDDHIHAPNENFEIDQFRLGARVMARLWDAMAEALPQQA